MRSGINRRGGLLARALSHRKSLDVQAPRTTAAAWRFDVDGDAYAILEWSELEVAFPDSLTTAEDAVARLLARGCTNREIALRRGTSERTVANQVASIFQKLRIDSRLSFFAWISQQAGSAS